MEFWNILFGNGCLTLFYWILFCQQALNGYQIQNDTKQIWRITKHVWFHIPLLGG